MAQTAKQLPMKAISLLSFPIAAVLAAGVSAQHPMGFSTGWDKPNQSDGTGVIHSPLPDLPEGDFLTRIDSSDFINWGLDPNVDPSYGTFALSGFEFVLQDIDGNTAETPAFMTGWSEDPVKPNFPDVPGYDPTDGGSNFMFAGPVPDSQFLTTLWTFTFTAPLPAIATGQDIFLGLSIGPAGSGEQWFTHGVGDKDVPVTNAVIFDDPGPGRSNIDEGSYVCIIPTLNQFPTGSPAIYTTFLVQNRFEVFLEHASGGVVTALTNQDSYVTSNLGVGSGTPNFLSGLHPDASSSPVNVGRNVAPPANWIGDRVGFQFTDSRLVASNLVFVVVSLSPNPAPFALTSIPGTGAAPTGLVLVDPVNHVGVGFGVAQPVSDPNFTYTRFSMNFDLPAVTRGLLDSLHPALLWQGFGLDSLGNIHATGLVRQQF